MLHGAEWTAAELARAYAGFDGPMWPELRMPIEARLADLVAAAGLAEAGEVFESHHRIRASVLRALCPDRDGCFLDEGPPDVFVAREVLAESDNPLFSEALPPPLRRRSGEQRRPALRLLQAPAGLRLLATPEGTMLFCPERGVFWRAASVRCYGRPAVPAEEIAVNAPLVVAQDMFYGANFCHFLFDWMVRVGLFAAAEPAVARACRFLLGGPPGPFQELVLERLCAVTGLDFGQFLFPTEATLLRLEAASFFFSDAPRAIAHPAFSAHPAAMRVVGAIAAAVDAPPGPVRRIYISRRDAGIRRVANEAALWRVLAARGFDMALMSTLPITEQIGLLRGATGIVAPHGMGLAHLAFHTGRPTLIELHNRAIGTDAYAVIARAMGCDYRAVLGEPVGNAAGDFVIDPALLEQCLDEAGLTAEATAVPPRRPAQGEWFGGVQSEPAAPVSYLPPPVPGEAVLRHRRDDPARQPDSNVGWWAVGALPRGAVYTASCALWLAGGFRFADLRLHVDGLWNVIAAQPADLACVDSWQWVFLCGVVRAAETNVVLRLEAEPGATVFSAGWEVRAGFRDGA
ncbi:MAG TPA: glycosyltransferase family 61 protein [Acetobacteraceae bacterium]|nr:glycosyltransferase family 61 protein [Acetobacteraceae bacterium]